MLSTIRRTSARSAASTKRESCPVCQISISLRGLKKHLASHQQQLALFALPPSVDDTETDEREDDEGSRITAKSDEDSLNVAEEDEELLEMAENDGTSEADAESSHEFKSEHESTQPYEARRRRRPSTTRVSTDYLRRSYLPPLVTQEDNRTHSRPSPNEYLRYADYPPNITQEEERSYYPPSSDNYLRTDLDAEGVSNASNNEIRLRVDGTIPLSLQLSGNMEGHAQDDFVEASAIEEAPQAVRVWPGMHQQQAQQTAARMAAQRQTQAAQQQQQQGKKVEVQQQSQVQSGTLRSSIPPTYAKIHQDYLEIDTLHYYDIPYEIYSDPNYLIVLRELSQEQIDVLFEHTRRLRGGKYPELASRTDNRGRTYSTQDEPLDSTMILQNRNTG
jgi:hypothetical protein